MVRAAVAVEVHVSDMSFVLAAPPALAGDPGRGLDESTFFEAIELERSCLDQLLVAEEFTGGDEGLGEQLQGQVGRERQLHPCFHGQLASVDVCEDVPPTKGELERHRGTAGRVLRVVPLVSEARSDLYLPIGSRPNGRPDLGAPEMATSIRVVVVADCRLEADRITQIRAQR